MSHIIPGFGWSTRQAAKRHRWGLSADYECRMKQMVDNMQTKLESIDTAILSEVVQQDQRSPSFEISEWSVRRLSDKGIINPDGLWIFNGEGNGENGSRHWSVVLKILTGQEEELPLNDLFYWKRELLLAQSRFVENLSGTVKAPRVYRAKETANGAWLWLEYIENHRPDPWVVDDYAFAAHKLGYWNGTWADGRPLPSEPWLTRHHYRSWYTETDPEQDFKFPLNQKHIAGAIRDRYEKLWAERKAFYSISEALPQTFSHFDSQRRNLFIRKGRNEQEELVLVDWALCGLGPLGAELNSLIAGTVALFEWPASQLPELDANAFAGYLRGLAEAGWSGDADLVRLGYVAWVTMWWGIVFPNITALWCTPQFHSYADQQFGLVEEELFLQWLPLFYYALDCADEARLLMKELRLP